MSWTSTVALPRLIPSMSPSMLTELSDRRNQLDAAVRLCVAAGVATADQRRFADLARRPGYFLPSPLTCCAGQAIEPVAAARGFSIALAAAVDLHHLQLFDALSLERPLNIAKEKSRKQVLTKLFRRASLSKRDKSMLHYIAQGG